MGGWDGMVLGLGGGAAGAGESMISSESGELQSKNSLGKSPTHKRIMERKR